MVVERLLISMAESGDYDLICTMGCVGFAARDVMPEVVRGLVDK